MPEFFIGSSIINFNSFFKNFIPASPPTTSSFNFFLRELITLSVESMPTSALINKVSKSSRDSGVSGSSPNLSNNSVTNPLRVSSKPLLSFVSQSISSIDI